MPDSKKPKERKRMVVEEVGVAPQEPPKEVETESLEVVDEVTSDSAPAITEEAASDVMAEVTAPVEEIKEKVEELQTLTEGISESAEKSAKVQEELVEAAQKVESIPTVQPQNTGDLVSYKKDRTNPLIIIIPGVLLLGALLGGIYFYQKNIVATQPTPLPAGTDISETPIATPTASPSSKLDLTKFPINVENGSGIPGTAGTAKDLLTKAGFKVSATGNAETYDYTDTVIETQASVPAEFVAKLTATLSTTYKVGTPKSLPASSSDEVVVIIGSNKAQ